jgi:propionyl-CoA carboxylase alpha chain
MFRKILIANRGEIACRVIKTARRMGIATVAVHSDADANALHVRMADEAAAIGPAPAAQSYLSIENIVAACKETGADAVHPGYGFLSERAEFVRALEQAGIAFIGPNANAIEAMGDKIESKKFAAKAKVSTVPGFLGVIEDESHAIRIAGEIGYPVMIKASAGGGGKGMRIAGSAADVAEGFARAKSEAKSSFGDDRVFIEKYIVNPRHIEIQVLGDKHGNVIHLNERECSIQRRNQKVIEESPSPLLDEKTRAAMGAQAVALAKAVGYDSAGTVEFVAGQDKSFFFLEMNTRLQVEHPVTELVTGIDLVEQMIRVAAGERLSLAQADVSPKGWAVESRIYAEDPYRGFLPSIGRLVRYRPPQEGARSDATVRVDSGVDEGGEISLYYDPMIAKLVTRAPDRAGAIIAMSDALDAFAIEGVQHNIPFLDAVMQNPRFRSGKLSTDFIAEEFPNGFHGVKARGETLLVLAAVAAALDHAYGERKRRISGQLTGRAVMREKRRVVRIGDAEVRLEVLRQEDAVAVRFDQSADAKRRTAILQSHWKPGDPVWAGLVDGDEIALHVRPLANGFLLSFRGAREKAYVYTEREAALARLMPARTAADAGKFVRSPMPGLVLSLTVAAGQEVKTGDTLAVVEAMKMENALRAERDGKVRAVHVKPGDSVAVDAAIVEFE